MSMILTDQTIRSRDLAESMQKKWDAESEDYFKAFTTYPWYYPNSRPQGESSGNDYSWCAETNIYDYIESICTWIQAKADDGTIPPLATKQGKQFKYLKFNSTQYSVDPTPDLSGYENTQLCLLECKTSYYSGAAEGDDIDGEI